jgi:hypothetical protein
MPATLLHRRPYGGASPAAIIHSACSPSPHPSLGEAIISLATAAALLPRSYSGGTIKEKEAMKASMSFPIHYS